MVFLLVVLNDMDIVMFDIGNAYLNAKTAEEIYTLDGLELGEDESKL